MNEWKMIKPTQDFVDGVFYYGVQREKEVVLVTSDRRMITAGQRRPAGIELAPTIPGRSGFSWGGAARYLAGSTVSPRGVYGGVRRYLESRLEGLLDAYYEVLTAWTLGTYVHQVFDTFPYLWLDRAPARAEGHRVLEALQPLVFNGAWSTGRDRRSTFRLADSAGTLLIGDLWRMHRRNRLHLLRQGYRKNAVFARREPGWNSVITCSYSSYCPKILLGDPKWQAVLWEATIPIPLPSAQTPPRRPTPEDELTLRALTDGLHNFGLSHAAEIARRHRAEPPPRGLEAALARERELWGPLFTLANILDEETGGETVTEALREVR